MLSTISASGKKPIGISKTCEIVYLEEDYSGKDHKNHLQINNLQPLPTTSKQREIVYICGPSGSGKSVFAESYIKQWQTMHPFKQDKETGESTNEVFIFSKVQNDPSLKNIKDPCYIGIDDQLIEQPILLDDLKDSLVLFDDIDQISDKLQTKAITQLIGVICEHGRHNNITCLITSHLINGNNKQQTRTILNECHKIILFPRTLNSHSLTYFLKNYIGICDKPTMKKIMDVPSRWVMVSKHYPLYCIYQHGVFMI